MGGPNDKGKGKGKGAARLTPRATTLISREVTEYVERLRNQPKNTGKVVHTLVGGSPTPLYAASWDNALHFPLDQITGLPPSDCPAKGYHELAFSQFSDGPLVITGETGSGKTLMAALLAATCKEAPMAVVIQQRRTPQMINAEFFSKIFRAEWQTPPEAARVGDIPKELLDQS